MTEPAARPGWFRRWYGSNPAHLVSLLLCFAVAAYAADRWLESPSRTALAVWFVGAIVAHDVVFFPVYSALDRLGLVAARGRRRRPGRVPVVNHVRVPVLFSGLLLLLWFPLIAGKPEAAYRAATGLSTSPYLGRWLAVSGLFVVVSALVYVVRVVRVAAGARARSGSEAKAAMPSAKATEADQPRS